MIAGTKKALRDSGINVASLEKFTAGKTDNMKRSNHVLLVKNLPYSSSESELAKMFGKFGSLDKIILPPTKTLALVCKCASILFNDGSIIIHFHCCLLF